MSKKNLIKLFSAIYMVGMVIWLGGSLMRMVIAYDIYVPATELQLKTNYSDEMRLHNVKLYGMGALYTDISYGFALTSAIFLIILMRGKIKEQGWPAIMLILFFLTVPVETLMIYFDIQLNFAIRNDNLQSFDSEVVRDFFISRFTKFNFMQPSAYLCGISSLIFTVVRPLEREK